MSLNLDNYFKNIAKNEQLVKKEDTNYFNNMFEVFDKQLKVTNNPHIAYAVVKQKYETKSLNLNN